LNKTKSFNYGELIIPIIMILFVVAFIYQGIGMRNFWQNFRFVWPILAVLLPSLGYIISKELTDYFKKRQEEVAIETDTAGETASENELKGNLLITQIILIICVLGYILLLDYLGFILCSMIFVPIVFLAVGVRSAKFVISASIIIPLVIFVLFRGVFDVIVPEGLVDRYLLENIIYAIRYGF